MTLGSSLSDRSLMRRLYSGPLDVISPPAAAAFGLRRLSLAHTGPLIRVRRSSDNAESDIGFLPSGGLDTQSLLAFTGANSAFVTTWYDQSGFTKNFTQTVAANQPTVVTAGVVNTLNGAPTISFNGSAWLSRTGTSMSTNANVGYSISVIFRTATAGAAFWSQTGSGWAWNGPGQFVLYLSGSAGNSSGFQFGSVQWGGGWTAGNQTIGSNSPTVALYLAPPSGAPTLFTNMTQNTLLLTPTRASGTPAEEHIGRGGPAGSNGTNLIVDLPELVLFPSNLGPNDSPSISREQGRFFGISVS